MTPVARRELATRRTSWATSLASLLATSGVTPNSVSIAGMAFAGTAAIELWLSGRTGAAARAGFLLLAAASVQLRLLCNLLDGMLAVEEGLQTATGVLYNEVPDRVSDVAILAAAGYSVAAVPAGVALGWAAAAAALFTAYVRLLGGTLSGAQHFIGPMAKPQRMFLLTLACVFGAVESFVAAPTRVMPIALAIIAVGSVVTAGRRLARIAAALEHS
jgi:phosphatidylglycerophosphate synthase